MATNCSQLKMPAAKGKMYKTDGMTTEYLFRLIQSIPSPKAEPFKLWMAQVVKEISESTNPECFSDHIQNAVDGATIAKNARIELEQKTGKAVVTPLNAREGIGQVSDKKASVFLEDEEEK